MEEEGKQQPSVVRIAVGVALGILAAVLVVAGYFAYQDNQETELSRTFSEIGSALD